MEVSPKDEKMLSRYSNFNFFFTHPFDFYIEIKHRDQLLSTTLKNGKERKIYFHPIEIYSEKTMT